MKETRIERIADGLWALDDAHQGSLYLIEGNERALLIDAGMGAEPLLPVLRTLTDKPIVLALTHAHVDHSGMLPQLAACPIDIYFQDMYILLCS